VTSNSKSTEKAPAVSLQNNLPNADAGAAPAAGNQEGRQEETTNYEIGKTVRAIVHDQPQIERVSLAVMVDGIDSVGADGKHSWKARDQAELDQIEKLVKSAVGFDEKRGDRLDVVSMPFVDAMESVDTTPAARPGKVNSDLITFVQMVAFGVVGFGIIILTARSIFTALNKQSTTLGIAGSGPVHIGSDGTPQLAAQPGSALAIEQNAAEGGRSHGVAGGGDDDDTMVMSNIQGQMRASSIRKVLQLVDRHPDTTLGIIRGWMSTDGG